MLSTAILSEFFHFYKNLHSNFEVAFDNIISLKFEKLTIKNVINTLITKCTTGDSYISKVISYTVNFTRDG